MKKNNQYYIFDAILKNEKIDFVKEYKFHPKRKWRFDYAIIDKKIAIEIEGGIWSKGRHINPKGFLNDCEKYNEATMLGWQLLRIPTDYFKNGFDNINKIVMFIKNKNGIVKQNKGYKNV